MVINAISVVGDPWSIQSMTKRASPKVIKKAISVAANFILGSFEEDIKSKQGKADTNSPGDNIDDVHSG